MSKLAKELRVDRVNSKRVMAPPSLLSDMLKVDETVGYVSPAYREYNLAIRLQCRAMLPEDDAKAMEYAIKNAKLSMIEAVFGEFREDFYRIRNALYEQEYHKAQELLHTMQQKMYEEM